MFFTKIKSRIIATLILVTLLTAAIIGSTSYILFRGVLFKQAVEIGLESARYNAEKIGSWIKEKKASIQRTAVHISSNKIKEEEEIRIMMQDGAKADPSFYSIFLGLENGQLIDAYGWIPPEPYDVRERPWYSLAIKKGETVLTPVYLDKNKNKLVTSIALPIRMQGQRGVFAGNIPLDQVLEQLKNVRYGKNGYGMLIDERGTIIAHKDKTAIFMSIEDYLPELKGDFLKNILTEKSGSEMLKIAGKNQLMVHVEVPGCGWKMILLAPVNDFLDPVNNLVKTISNILLISAVVLIIVGAGLGNTISEPIARLIQSIGQLSRGNLTEKIHARGNDEVAQLAKAINQMRENHAEVIQKIQQEVGLLHEQAERLSVAVENISYGVTDFVSQLSHDIKTPLTLIKGYTKGMQIGVADTPEKTKEYLAGIYARSEHIEKLAEDILDSIYDVRQHILLDRRAIAVNDVVMRFHDTARCLVEAEGRTLLSRADCIEGALNVDELKLLRVWNNLLTNSIKYSEQDTEISIEIMKVGDVISFSVLDRGIGIKSTDLEKIFDMFYRAKEKDVKGYGIGLAISKVIVEAHGGVLRAESVHGERTRFTVLLPIQSN